MKISKKDLWIFMAPTMVLLLIFTFVPFIAGVLISFFQMGVKSLLFPSTIKFVGLANFWQVLTDPIFYHSLWNTVIVLVVALPIGVVVSLSLAVLIGSKLVKFPTLYRVGYYLPAVSNGVAVALVWKWLLNPDLGLVNSVLAKVGITGPNWLNDPHTAILCIIALCVWGGLGGNVIFYSASLGSISESVKEAAELDGANGFQKFRHIYVPLLVPTTVYIGIMSLIGYLQLFNEPMLLTNGGPVNNTMSVVLYIYQKSFGGDYNLGYASAISVVLMLIIVAISYFNLRKFSQSVDFSKKKKKHD